MNLFGFVQDYGTHEFRKIATHDDGVLFVDTCRVSDGVHPIETAVEHPDYNNGKMVIVAAYDTVEDARKGHDEWVARMSTEPLPDKLVDCCNSSVSRLADAFGAEIEFPRKKGGT